MRIGYEDSAKVPIEEHWGDESDGVFAPGSSAVLQWHNSFYDNDTNIIEMIGTFNEIFDLNGF